MKKVVYRKCPFCEAYEFGIEHWGRNLYLLSCLNRNTSAAYWVELKRNGRYGRVSVEPPKEKQRMDGRLKSDFDKLQTPFWKLMGQKPKAKDVAYEKYLKSKNMTYGDAVLERNLYADNPSAINKLEASR